MPVRHPRRVSVLSARIDQPLIAVIFEEGGQEVVRYFTDEEAADEALPPGVTEQALSVIGSWGDLDWDEMEACLYRIRHDTPPTPPIEL